jgi:hypothetical protein
MNPLSNDQKRIVSQLARRAYLAWPDREAFELINSEQSATACFEDWRHVEQGKAVGIQSLRECTQAHYGRLVAHFKALGGDETGARRALGRDADNGRRIARHKLDQALAVAGLQPSYAAAICRTQYRCELGNASEKQLWNLYYTVKARRPAPVRPEPEDDGNPF